MTKITIHGDALVLTSGLKLETLRKTKKYRPDALVLRDKEKNPVFSIDVGTKTASANKNGVVFVSASHDENGYATYTEMIPTGMSATEAKTYAEDKFGAIILKMNALEETLGTTLAEIEADVASVQAAIDVQ